MEILQKTENWQIMEQFYAQNLKLLNRTLYFDIYAVFLARKEDCYELGIELLTALNNRSIDSEHISQYLEKLEDNLCHLTL